MTFLKGIDVSKYQSPSDWSPTGLTFVVARASIGTTPDAQYAGHIAKAKQYGLLTGAYHFNWDPDYSGSASPTEQAQFFVKQAGDVDFLFLDVEGAMAFEAAEMKEFIAEVHRLGKKCGLYMSAAVYNWRVGQDYDWVAKWSSTQPSGDWEFWQYTSSGRATDGGRLDLDYFNASLDTLRSLSNREYHLDMTFGIFNTPMVAVAQKGDWLYDNPACEPSTGNIMLDPGRELPISGRSSDGKVFRVGYRDTTPTESLLKEMYVPAASVTVKAVEPSVADDGVTQATVDAAVAAQKAADDAAVAALNAKVEELTKQVKNLGDMVTESESRIADAQQQQAQAEAAQEAAEALVAPAKALQEALKAFIS